MEFKTKKEAREYLRTARLAIPEKKKKKADRLCMRTLERLPEFDNADTVLLYAPIHGEPDLIPLAIRALALKKKVAFPVSNPDTLTLTFKRVKRLDKLCEGAYGILEPPKRAKKARITKKTLCIVPALSFDIKGNRLGYGKGYYDRFLSGFKGTSLGVVYRSLLSMGLPTDSTDVPVDIVLTETGVLRINEILQKERGER